VCYGMLVEAAKLPLFYSQLRAIWTRYLNG
jgi:hypothetical protein